MANKTFWQEVEGFFATLDKDALATIGWTVDHLEKFIKVLKAGLDDEPLVAEAVVGLVKACAQVGVTLAAAAAADGLSEPRDAAVVAAGESVIAYVKGTFLPVVEKFGADLEAATE